MAPRVTIMTPKTLEDPYLTKTQKKPTQSVALPQRQRVNNVARATRSPGTNRRSPAQRAASGLLLYLLRKHPYFFLFELFIQPQNRAYIRELHNALRAKAQELWEQHRGYLEDGVAWKHLQRVFDSYQPPNSPVDEHKKRSRLALRRKLPSLSQHQSPLEAQVIYHRAMGSIPKLANITGGWRLFGFVNDVAKKSPSALKSDAAFKTIQSTLSLPKLQSKIYPGSGVPVNAAYTQLGADRQQPVFHSPARRQQQSRYERSSRQQITTTAAPVIQIPPEYIARSSQSYTRSSKNQQPLPPAPTKHSSGSRSLRASLSTYIPHARNRGPSHVEATA